MKPIILTPNRNRTLGTKLTGVVPISPEAEMVLRRVCRLSGIPLRAALSQIIIQAEELLLVAGVPDISDDDDGGDE